MANKSLGIEFKATDNVSGTVQEIERQIDSLGDKEKDLQKISERFEKITNSTMPVKRQLRELQMIMANMNLKGLTDTDVFTEIATKAGEMKDAIADANDAVNRYASDTMNLEAAAQAFQGIAAAGSIATGAIALLGDENKDLVKILTKVQAAQSILNGVMAIANILNKDSALMLKIKQIRQAANVATTVKDTAATTANTVATTANTVAVTANTTAQNAHNVALAVCKALFGDFTGLAIVAAAGLMAYGVAAATSADEQEELNSELERGKNVQNAYYDEYNSNLSKTMSSYSRLQTSWNQLKSESEKNQWIKDNKDAFNDLGFEINNTADAERFFVQNEAKVIASFTARAEAAALAAQQVELFNQALKDIPQVGDIKSAKWFGENNLGTKGRQDKNQGFMRFEYKYEFTEADRQKLIDDRLKAARETGEKLSKLQLDAEKRASNLAAEAGVKEYKKKKENLLKKGGKTTSKVEIKTDPNSLTAAENELKQLEEVRSKMNVDSPDLSKVNAAIDKLKKDIEQKKIKLGIEAEIKIESGSEEDIDNKIKELEKKKIKLQINSDEWLKLDDQINALKDKLELATKGVEVKAPNIKDALNGQISETINGYKQAIQVLENSLQGKKLNIVNTEDISAKIQEVQTELNSLDPNTDKFEESKQQLQNWIDKLEELKDKAAKGVEVRAMDLDGGKTFDEYTSKIKEYKQSLEGLESTFEKNIQTPAEKSREKLQSLADSVGQIGSAFSTSAQAFKLMGDESTAAALQVVGSMSDMVAQVIPQIMALIGVKEGEAMASGTASAAALPFPANIAAIATIVATVISTFATIASVVGSFADGGIIQGASHHGDHMLARVNAGEMIINQKDQKRLWDFIHEGKTESSGGVVIPEVKLKGSDIYLSFKNYTKINKKKI